MSYIDDVIARGMREAERADKTLRVVYDILEKRQQPEEEDEDILVLDDSKEREGK